MTNKKKLFLTLTILALLVGSLIGLRAWLKNPSRILARADQYYSDKALDEARLEYLKVLRTDPINPIAIRQLGMIWSDMGSPLQAGMFLKHASGTAPDDLAVRSEFAKVLASTGQPVAARTEARTILRQDPANGEALLMLANTSYTPDQLAEVVPVLETFDPATSFYYHLTAAILAGREGDLDAAGAAINKAAAVNPFSAPVQMALSAYYDAIKNPDQSLEALHRASDLSPGPTAARLRYAKALAERGKSDEAIALLKEITESSRYFLPAWGLLAELTLKAGDPTGAMTMVNEILSRDNTNPEAHLLRASILQADGKNTEAVRSLEELNGMFSGSPAILLTLAKAYLIAGDSVRGGSTLDEILIMDPRPPQAAEATVLKARLDVAAGSAAPAAAALEKLAGQQSGQARLQTELELVRAYRSQGRLDAAAAIFEKQIADAPGKPSPLFMLGMLRKEQGQLAEAAASLEKAQALAPGDTTITFQLIELDIARRDFASAHQRAAAQEKLHPGDWSPFYLQGAIHSAQENWAEAEKSLLRAIELKPDSLISYNLLLQGYMTQNRIPEVITRLEAYLQEKPDSIPQWQTLALIYGRQGNKEKEVDAYEKLLAIDPGSKEALNNLAYLYAGPLKQPERALELARQAREKHPDSPEIADTLGWILFQREDYPQALLLLEEAAAQLPDSAEAQYHLGMARYMRGQKDAARTALESAVKAGQEFAGIAQAREYLARLDGTGETGPAATIESLTERLKETPGDLVARTALAGLQEAAGQFPEAAASYEEALKANPRLAPALIGLANLYSGPLADPAQAAEYARQARTVDDRNPTAAIALGTAVLLQGDFRYAYTLLKEGSRNTPADPALSARLARAAYGYGRTSEARDLMQSVADAGSETEAAAAKQFLSLTDAPATLTGPVVEAALRESPSDPAALMASAELASGADAAAAISIYRSILKQHPDFVPAQVALASLLASRGEQLEEALKLADAARQALPEDPRLSRTMGILRFLKDNADVAVRLLKDSNARSPLDADGQVWLGLAQLKAGQAAEGLSTLKTAVAANPSVSLLSQATEAITKAEEAAAKAAEAAAKAEAAASKTDAEPQP